MMSLSQPSNAIVAPKPLRNGFDLYGLDPGWQLAWLATLDASWRSLAIVPAEPGVATWDIAQAFLGVALRHQGSPVVAADLRSVTLAEVAPLLREVERRIVDGGERVLMALSCVDASPGSSLLAKAADRALLCVQLGSSSVRLAETAIQTVGRDHFLGTLLLRAAGRPSAG